jgi:DNA-binding transcriptional LysR family regulator
MTKYPRHLIEAFMTFATFGNVIKTSTTLGISQPALSRQLQQLEELVGERLFQKQGRQKVLSPIGQELFSRIKPTWQNYDPLVDGVISKFKSSPRQALRIYGPGEILARSAMGINFPHPLVFVPTRSPVVADKVASEEICIGITRVVPNNMQFTARTLFKEGFQIIYPAKWKITPGNSEARLLRQLGEFPMVSYGEDFVFPKKIWAKYKLNTSPTIMRVLPNWEALQTMVEEGVGWGIAPTNLIRKSSKFVSVPLSHELMESVTYYLLYKKDLTRIPWFKSLVNNFLEVYA